MQGRGRGGGGVEGGDLVLEVVEALSGGLLL